jgi:hypothetical protein
VKALTPAAGARVKRGVKAAIVANEGIDEAKKVVKRERSTVGRWLNRNDPDTPPLDAAIALDDVALRAGAGAPILQCYALELGGVVFFPPEAPIGEGEFFERLASFSAEVGDVFQTASASLADGKLTDDEIDENVKQLDDVMQVVAEMRAAFLAQRSAAPAKGGK